MLHLVKAVILLLVFNALHVHCKSVLKTEKLNEEESMLTPKTYYGREKCASSNDCSDTQKCAEDTKGSKTCQCSDGMNGPFCQNKAWCDDSQKYGNCKGENGTCEYNKEQRAVVCRCGEGRALHTEENRCRETCSLGTECQYEGECVNVRGHSFCSCKPGLVGDKCSVVFDCTKKGKYRFCKYTGGQCSYDIDSQQAVCECFDKMKLHDTNRRCEECDCGPKGTCSFLNGTKVCNCSHGSVEKEGRCTETCYSKDECEYDGECIKDGEHSFCSCKPGIIGDKCNIPIHCARNVKYIKCENSGGKCSYDINSKEAACKCFDKKKFHDTHHTCEVCDCGLKGTCAFQNGQKTCSCFKGFTEMNGKCIECNCGVNAELCFYGGNGTKICKCNFGYIQTNGHCSAICNEDKCVHGKCEINGNYFKCRCKEGFWGRRCEEKIQTKSNKENLLLIMLLSVAVAIFALLSGMFCFLSRILKRISAK